MVSVSTDHKCLWPNRKIGKTKPRTQRWTEFLSAYNISMSYDCGKDNANADSLPLNRALEAFSPFWTRSTLASTASAPAAYNLLPDLSLELAWVG